MNKHVRKTLEQLLWWLPLLLAGSTLWLWYTLRTGDQKLLSARMQDEARQTGEQLYSAFQTVDGMLHACKGFFDGSDSVSRSEWAEFVKSLDPTEYNKGIQIVGFIRRVPAGGKAAHLREVRAEIPDYAVYPPGAREEYFPAVYQWPERAPGVGRRGIGYDAGSEPELLTAMNAALDSDKPRASATVLITPLETGATARNGFIVFVPVFGKGRPSATPEQRRANLYGYAYISVITQEMASVALGEKAEDIWMKFSGFDRKDEPRLIYDSQPNGAREDVGDGYVPEYSASLDIQRFGRDWREELFSLPTYGERYRHGHAIVLLSGLLLTVLSIGLARAQSLRGKALDEAEAVNEELKLTRSVVDESSLPVILEKEDTTFYYANRAAAELLGYSHPELMKLTALDTDTQYVTIADWRKHWAECSREGRRSCETTLKGNGGAVIPVEMTGNFVKYGGRELKCLFIHDLTRRKKYEAERIKLSRAVEEAPATVVITDARGDIEYVNRKFVELTGYSPEEARGNNPRVLKSGEHSAAFYKELWNTITSGRTWHGEFHNKKKNGELYWEMAAISPIAGKDGKITGYLAIKEDITGRKEIEKRLRESEERYHLLFERSKDAIMTLAAPSWKFTAGNRATVEMFDCEDEADFVAHAPGDLSPERQPDGKTSAEKSLAMIADAMKKGFVSFEWVHRRRNGESFPAIVQLTKMTMGGREFLHAVVRDVTEQKRAQQALQESEAKFRAMVETTNDMVWELDTNGAFTYVSPRFDTLGYPVGGFLGRTPFEYMDVSDVEDIKAFFVKISVEKKPFTGLEHTMRHKDGRLMRWEASGAPNFDSSGEYRGWRGISRDITDRKEAEEELRRAKEEADSANRTKSVFLANMSHEIRTPLNAILGFSQLMLRDAAATPAQRKQLDTINRSGSHLLDLINDILEMSKIEAHRAVLDEAPFDLRATAEDVDRMFRERAAAKGLRLDVEMAADLPVFIFSDERKVRQILVNLLGNALKFTSEGGISLRLRSRPCDGGGLRLTAEVEDTGNGMAPGELTALFQPFEQGQAGRSSGGGTGLGLAICRQYARLMGGDISVKSEQGKGSLFTLEVCVREATASAAGERKDQRRVKMLKPGQPPCRVLVVDDKEDNREFLAQLLAQTGFEVRLAADGEEAVAGFSDWNPSLILMDIKMPVLNGYEATRVIRTKPGGREVKIIVLSASSFGDVRKEALEKGADDYLSKPFRENDLFEKISAHTRVQYEYEMLQGQAVPVPAAAAVRASRGELSRLAPESAGALKKAASEGDFDRVQQIAGELGDGLAGLAAALKDLAGRFDGQAILDLLEANKDR